MLEKLKKAIDDRVPNIVVGTTAPAPTGFCSAARWKLVDSANLPSLPELENEIEGAYAPTDILSLIHISEPTRPY